MQGKEKHQLCTQSGYRKTVTFTKKGMSSFFHLCRCTALCAQNLCRCTVLCGQHLCKGTVLCGQHHCGCTVLCGQCLCRYCALWAVLCRCSLLCVDSLILKLPKDKAVFLSLSGDATAFSRSTDVFLFPASSLPLPQSPPSSQEYLQTCPTSRVILLLGRW